MALAPLGREKGPELLSCAMMPLTRIQAMPGLEDLEERAPLTKDSSALSS